MAAAADAEAAAGDGDQSRYDDDDSSYQQVAERRILAVEQQPEWMDG